MHSLGTGTDGITDSPYLGKDVIVTATRGIHGVPMSEMAFLLMLAFAARLSPDRAAQRAAKKWERFPGTLLDEKTVGILGLGAIAEDMAPRFKAFGMRVVGISRTNRADPGLRQDLFARRDRAGRGRAGLLRAAGAARRRHPQHRQRRACSSAMKPSAFLINLARGGVLDEDALIRALNDKKIAGAALDALAKEPLPADSPLWTMPNVIITPHIGGYCDTYVRDAARAVRAEPRAFRAGKPELMLHREKRG